MDQGALPGWANLRNFQPRNYPRRGVREYPLIVGRDGAQYWVVDGMKPHPYFHPAAFNRRGDNVDAVKQEIIALVTGGGGATDAS